MRGYGSFRRRLARLGHISLFGRGSLKLLFAFTHHLAPSHVEVECLEVE